MRLSYPPENRFQSNHERKAWMEYLFASICTQSLALFAQKTMPVEFKQLQQAAKQVVAKPVAHQKEANEIANIIIYGSICDTTQKKPAILAIVFTAAAETVNHRNYFTVGYQNEPFGIACQNLLANARKRTDANTFEHLQYENFTMIGNIARSYCNNEHLIIEAYAT
ncbi:MAG: hypothetical protein NZ519_05115 [Bacteroidia bacterium]|nr:hypothetical protein [Bacteroidia bacterium]